MRWAIRTIVVLILVALLILGFCVYKGISTSLHAEHVLHAALLTVQLLDEYVDGHDGAWPGSWADLENLSYHEGGMFKWPKDSEEIQRYVKIDFSADLQRLAKQKVGEFDAVQPIGPYYSFEDDWRVEKLLETIREHSDD